MSEADDQRAALVKAWNEIIGATDGAHPGDEIDGALDVLGDSTKPHDARVKAFSQIGAFLGPPPRPQRRVVLSLGVSTLAMGEAGILVQRVDSTIRFQRMIVSLRSELPRIEMHLARDRAGKSKRRGRLASIRRARSSGPLRRGYAVELSSALRSSRCWHVASSSKSIVIVVAHAPISCGHGRRPKQPASRL